MSQLIISPATLRASLVTNLRALTGLTALLGGSAKIQEYLHQVNGNFYSELVSVGPETLLVRHSGTLQNLAGRVPWRHSFEIIVQTNLDPAAIYAEIMNGIPPGSGGLPMWRAQVDPAYHPMSEVVFAPQSVLIGQNTSWDYWSLTFNFDSKGTN